MNKYIKGSKRKQTFTPPKDLELNSVESLIKGMINKNKHKTKEPPDDTITLDVLQVSIILESENFEDQATIFGEELDKLDILLALEVACFQLGEMVKGFAIRCVCRKEDIGTVFIALGNLTDMNSNVTVREMEVVSGTGVKLDDFDNNNDDDDYI